MTSIVSYLLPVLTLIGLWGFYIEIKIRNSSNNFLGVIIFAIFMQFIISIISFIIMLIPLFKIMFLSLDIFGLIITFTISMVLYIEALYYTFRSIYTLYELVGSGIKNQTSIVYFKKASFRWLLYGMIELIIILINLINEELLSEIFNKEYI